jgi:hypothetical protein
VVNVHFYVVCLELSSSSHKHKQKHKQKQKQKQLRDSRTKTIRHWHQQPHTSCSEIWKSNKSAPTTRSVKKNLKRYYGTIEMQANDQQ